MPDSNKVVWTPSQRMADLENHTVTIGGTAQAPDGEIRSVNFTNWGFQTSGDSGLLYKSNFQQFDSGTEFRDAEADIVFGTTRNRKNFDRGWTWNERDPKGLRGNVLSIELPKGQHSQKVSAAINLDALAPDIWLAYDVLFLKGYLFGSGFKMPMGMESNQVFGSRVSDGGWSYGRFMCYGNPSIPANVVCWPQGDGVTKFGYLPRDKGVFTTYYSYMSSNTSANANVTRPMNQNDPFTRINTTGQEADNWIIPDDEWVELAVHFRMNDVSSDTSGPNGGASYDSMDNPTYRGTGMMDFYVNGKLMWSHSSGVIIRNDTQVLWEFADLSYFYGGNDDSWVSPTCGTQKMFIDNIRISDLPLI